MSMLSWLRRQNAKSDFRPATEPETLKASDTEATSDAIIFSVVYGKHATAEELSRMRDYRVSDKGSWPGRAHRLIAINDRQSHPTPFLVRFGPEDIEYQNYNGFDIALDKDDHSVSMHIKHHSELEHNVTAFLRKELKPGMHFLDIGANIGYYSLLGSTLVGSEGIVQAFEPNSENCRLILLSRERNGFNQLRLHAVALGGVSGTAFFSPHLGSNGGFVSQTSDQLANPQCVVVPVMRLDEMVSGTANVIKMDVEGAEGLVLDGADQVLRDHRPTIVSEFSIEMLTRVSRKDPRDFLDRIKSYGYNISRLVGRDGEEAAINDVGHFLSHEAENIWELHELIYRPA